MFRDVTATQLAAAVLVELMKRTGIDPAAIDDVILGQCYPSGEAPAIGRVVALDAGLPITVPGVQIDRRCGSGLQAILNAAMQVETGVSEIVVAGGCESMSQVEFYSTEMRYGTNGKGVMLHDRLTRARETAGGNRYPVPGGMVETAENLRREYSISRMEQDELALASHQRAPYPHRDPDRHRRTSTDRQYAGKAGAAGPGHGTRRRTSHGDGRQCEWPE
jgi:acetyl-CoA C-acetyltransferase